MWACISKPQLIMVWCTHLTRIIRWRLAFIFPWHLTSILCPTCPFCYSRHLLMLTGGLKMHPCPLHQTIIRSLPKKCILFVVTSCFYAVLLSYGRVIKNYRIVTAHAKLKFKLQMNAPRMFITFTISYMISHYLMLRYLHNLQWQPGCYWLGQNHKHQEHASLQHQWELHSGSNSWILWNYRKTY